MALLFIFQVLQDRIRLVTNACYSSYLQIITHGCLSSHTCYLLDIICYSSNLLLNLKLLTPVIHHIYRSSHTAVHLHTHATYLFDIPKLYSSNLLFTWRVLFICNQLYSSRGLFNLFYLSHVLFISQKQFSTCALFIWCRLFIVAIHQMQSYLLTYSTFDFTTYKYRNNTNS